MAGLTPLEEHDPELFDLIEQEKHRQWCHLELIASENFTSRAVMDCLSSCLTNKYAEGQPGKRYYGGTQIVDQIEELCQRRALEAFGLDPEEWGVNVQPYSGSPANFAVYTALLKPHDRIMGLDLPSGGHLTHGFYTQNKADKTFKPVSATSVYFESLPYRVHPETGLIDFERLRELAQLFKPSLVICGASAYPRDIDYQEFKNVAVENGAILMMDMAHVSGLIAAGELNNPFEHCDIVTTTTHKTLRGPRAGMIFYRKDERDFETKINNAVFPALQGGPHENSIAGIATQLREVMTPEFKTYARQIKANAAALGEALIGHGYTICTGGTDNHLILWDLRPHDVTGSKMEKLCDAISITLNKNSVPGDRSAISPGGVRIGTPALTSRGLTEEHFQQIAEFLHRGLQITIQIQEQSGRKLKDFIEAMEENEEIRALKQEVEQFGSQFPMPGFDAETMRYREL